MLFLVRFLRKFVEAFALLFATERRFALVAIFAFRLETVDFLTTYFFEGVVVADVPLANAGGMPKRTCSNIKSATSVGRAICDSPN